MSDVEFFLVLVSGTLFGFAITHVVNDMAVAIFTPPKPATTPRPADPYFDPTPPKPEMVEVVEFQPKPKFDIDAMFDEAIDVEAQKKIEAMRITAQEERAKARKERDRREKIEPIRQAFEHLIETRKPMVVQRRDEDPPAILCVNQSTSGDLRIHFKFYISIEWLVVPWCEQTGYRVYVSGKGGNSFRCFDRWQDAFNCAIKELAPFIVGYDGKSSLEGK